MEEGLSPKCLNHCGEKSRGVVLAGTDGFIDPGKCPSCEQGLMQPKPGSECGISMDQSHKPLASNASDTTFSMAREGLEQSFGEC